MRLMALVALALVPLTLRARDATLPVLVPLPIETVLRTREFAAFTPLAFSRDGHWLAYVVREKGTTADSNKSPDWYRTGVDWNLAGGRVWIMNTTTGATQLVPDGNGSSWGTAWSADGEQLAFISDRALDDAAAGGDAARSAHLWLWERRSGTARPICALPVRDAGPPAWSADGRRLLVRLLPEGMTVEAYAARDAAPDPEGSAEAALPGATVTVLRSGTHLAEAPVNGPSSLTKRATDLAWVDIATGTATRLVHDAQTQGAQLAPDGSAIAYTIPLRFERAGWQQVLYDLIVLTDTTRTVVAHAIRLGPTKTQFSWAPDSRSIAYQTCCMSADGEVYVVPVAGGVAPRLLTGGPHPTFEPSYDILWDAAGRSVYFTDHNTVWRVAVDGRGVQSLATLPPSRVTTAHLLAHQFGQAGQLYSPDGGRSTLVLTRGPAGTSGFVRVNLTTGAMTPLLDVPKHFGGGYWSSGLGWSADGRWLAFVEQDVAHAPDLYLAEQGDVVHASRRTTLNPDFDHYVMGRQQILTWRTIDGDTVHGVLLLPAGYRSGARYPLITIVYGGEQPTQYAASRFGLSAEMDGNLQLYSTRGYAVLLPDLPIKEGTVVLDLLKVALPGVDKVVELGIADPARLGLTGHSFGGYNTIALLTETTRFKAAMMVAGLADVMGLYGALTHDEHSRGIGVIEQGQFLVHGTPWEYPLRYFENSPIWHLDRITTPLLIVHGDADEAVPVFLGDQIFSGLRRLNKEVEYAKYRGSGHFPEGYANVLDYWTRALQWFDTRLDVTRDAQGNPIFDGDHLKARNSALPLKP